MKRFLTIFVIALLVRTVVLVFGACTDTQRTIAIEPDSARYFILADNLLNGHGFAKDKEDGLVHTSIERLRRKNHTWIENADGWHPEVFRTPIYPAMIALLGGSKGIIPLLVIQCLLGSLTAAMISTIGYTLFCNRVAWISGILWALHPAVIIFDCIPLTESLFCFLGVAAIYVATSSKSKSGYVISGVLLGLCAITRPLGLLYLPFVLIVLYLNRISTWKGYLLTITIALAPLVAWSLRNYSYGNGFRVSTVSDINIYYYAVNYLRSEQTKSDWFISWPNNVVILTNDLERTITQGEDVYSAMRSQAIKELTSDLRSSTLVAIKSQFKLLSDHTLFNWYSIFGYKYVPTGFMSSLLDGGSPTKFGSTAIVPLLWSLANIVLMLLCLVGAIKLIRRREYVLLLLLLYPIAAFSLASFPVGLERFRLPFMPFIFLLASLPFAGKVVLEINKSKT